MYSITNIGNEQNSDFKKKYVNKISILQFTGIWLWCLTLLSTIFQLYRSDYNLQVYA